MMEDIAISLASVFNCTHSNIQKRFNRKAEYATVNIHCWNHSEFMSIFYYHSEFMLIFNYSIDVSG